MVSIGPVDDVFLYYYGKPIKLLPESEGTSRKDPSWTYFCMGSGSDMPAFDLPYEKLGVVSVEAAYSDHPRNVVILGRLRTEVAAARPNDRAR